MDFLYFLITSENAWSDKFGFHKNYFIENNAFLTGFLIAVSFSILLTLLFYFGCCNGKSNENAKPLYWFVLLAVVAVGVYFVGDAVVIGAENTSGSFYEANQKFCTEYCRAHVGNEQTIKECRIELAKITKDLNEGCDVAFMFNLTNVILSLTIFYLMSLIVKGFTKHGSCIPHK